MPRSEDESIEYLKAHGLLPRPWTRALRGVSLIILILAGLYILLSLICLSPLGQFVLFVLIMPPRPAWLAPFLALPFVPIAWLGAGWTLIGSLSLAVVSAMVLVWTTGDS